MKPAGFLVRLLADLIDFFLFALSFSATLFILAQSQTLAQLIFGLFVYLTAVALPLGIIGIFYKPFFTHRFGGNIGKLITGLRVTDLHGHLLTFKKALFRYTIGYTFSAVLFNLGFFSIIKDSDKRAFHDKATPSKVVITRVLWPLGLIVLIILFVTHFMLWSNTIQRFSNSPIKSEFGFLMLNLSQQLKEEGAGEMLPSPQPKLDYLLEEI